MRTSRIYPVPLKPASTIRSWRDWPEDVVEILKAWNGSWSRPGNPTGGCNRPARHGHRLSFWGHGVFKCPDCERFCEPQRYGTAVLDGDELCDDCLIARARSAD